MKYGFFVFFGMAALIGGTIVSFPLLLTFDITHEQHRVLTTPSAPFPVTVDPRSKTIVENAEVNAFFEDKKSPLTAAVASTGTVVGKIFEWIALRVASAPWYQNLAAVDGRFVVITSGMRKEQVVSAFGYALGWNSKEKQEFLTTSKYSSLPLPEGSYSPGIYPVSLGSTPLMAQAMVNDRFSADVLAHYSTTTAQVVPLNQALTIASLIEREAGGPGDMRIISGIIWNRLFMGMPLQIDATLQYAKASALQSNNWWPKVVVPADLHRKSAYNTYIHPGLPPAPIANPSVASVLAALNPVNTSCIFYFHDASHHFHCSDTYTEHVALLKQYFGRGK